MQYDISRPDPLASVSADKWNWLHKRFLLDMFEKNRNKAKKQYKDFVQDEDSAAVIEFFNKKNLPSIFGSQKFIEWVKATNHHLENHQEIPQSRNLAPTIAAIKQAVCNCYTIEQSILAQTRRGQMNEPRNVAVYLARKRCGLRLDEIGREFAIKKYSSVSSIVTRTEKQLLSDKQMQRRVEEVLFELNKGQAKI